jgi:excisionase family DNA binding protein
LGNQNMAEILVSDGLCTVKDATKFWGIKKTLVYSLMERGDVPYVRIGRRRLIPKKVLVNYAAKNLIVRKEGIS